MQIHELPEGTLNENDVMAVDDGQTTRKVSLNGVVPYPSTSSPLMDGTASAGESAYFARADHRHPTDTSRVAKTGDTMSGALSVDNNSVIIKGDKAIGTAPASNYYGTGVYFRDKNNTNYGYVREMQLPDGKSGVYISAEKTVGGTTTYHGVQLVVDDDGASSVTINKPAEWRDALQLSIREVVVENKTATISSVAANSASTGATLTVTKSGYTFLGVVGFSASTNAVTFGRCYRASATTVGYFVRNVTSSAVSNVTLTFNCLYYR